MVKDLTSLRENYKKGRLEVEDVERDPLLQFKKWFEEYETLGVPDANAMVLATATANGQPDARVVLLKEIQADGFVFFTNYKSTKGQQLAENPRATLLFFWPELERQIRITGSVEKISEIESEAYFQSRPIESQIGAVTSPQSQEIPSRAFLESSYWENAKKYETTEKIPRPEFWGGYLVRPTFMEFWQGRPSRLHDRICFEKILGQPDWRIYRVAP
jgi:pyridoxamine 5'-phosphate oxidase